MSGWIKINALVNLTRDPELKYTPKGTAVVNFGVAANSVYKDSEGKEHKEVCYAEVEAWGTQAENAKKYLTKGRLVQIFGDLKFDQWEADGEKKNRHRIRASEIHYMPTGNGPKAETAAPAPAKKQAKGR